ncbi:MAG: hypothetical protein ABSE25_11015 [Syntrophorhabdales bacterium]|jgi:hypothetical protein
MGFDRGEGTVYQILSAALHYGRYLLEKEGVVEVTSRKFGNGPDLVVPSLPLGMALIEVDEVLGGRLQAGSGLNVVPFVEAPDFAGYFISRS